MSRSKRGPTTQVRADYLSALPVGTWFFEYGGPLTCHRLGNLTPDLDMLRDAHRYALCGYGPIDATNGCREDESRRRNSFKFCYRCDSAKQDMEKQCD